MDANPGIPGPDLAQSIACRNGRAADCGAVRSDYRHGRRYPLPGRSSLAVVVFRGFTNREIANQLVLSEKTVRNYVERTYHKIGATNRVGASLYALQNGLVTVLN